MKKGDGYIDLGWTLLRNTPLQNKARKIKKFAYHEKETIYGVRFERPVDKELGQALHDLHVSLSKAIDACNKIVMCEDRLAEEKDTAE